MIQPSKSNFFHRFPLWAFLVPLVIVCLPFVFLATNGVLHDYSNNYFPALLAVEGITHESVVFDIFNFNSYIWSKGYPNELTDFYLNSPFIATLFYPFALLQNAYYSKLIYNLLCLLLFVRALMVLGKTHIKKEQWPLLLLIPLVFFIPIRNNIAFGQLYLLITSLVLLGYHYIEQRHKVVGEALLSLAVFIKIFPVFYCAPLLFSKKWKSVITLIFFGILLWIISILTGGWSFWQTYLFEVLPNAISNESTVDFRSNAQSIEVFLKTLLVRDAYYNPDAIFNHVLAYKIASVLLKSLVWAIAIVLSLRHKNQLFKMLSIWVVALFLTQPRTATYAQILWLIPTIEVIRSTLSKNWKISFICLLLVVCNFPFHWLRGEFLFIEFSRLWLSIALAGIAFYSFGFRFSLNFSKAYLITLVPLLTITLLKKADDTSSEYVLSPNTLFMIHDFDVENEKLIYKALGKSGNETHYSNIKIESLERSSCYVSNNQVFYQNRQLTNNNAIKIKPALVNGCEVYYLTDHHSRRGAFTLKKINVCF